MTRTVAIVAWFCLVPWLGCENAGQDGKDGAIKPDSGYDASADDSATGNDSATGDDAGPANDAEPSTDGDAGEPITPEVAPVTAAEAERLGAYARKLRCASQGGPPLPVAWSMVNISCQDRMMALAYAVAAADPALEGEPPPMVDTEMTVERINELAEHPSFDAATINVAGPLVTRQTLIGPDGEAIGDHPLEYYWPYHHAVILNVEGELRVLDLSVGDAPLPMDEWLKGFVEPSITCRHASDEAHQQVWVYWNSAFSNFELPEPPPVSCSYTITPLFTMRRDQVASEMADAIGDAPFAMNNQLGSFETTLSAEYGVSLTREDLPKVTSRYSPGTTDDVCNWARMRFCDQF